MSIERAKKEINLFKVFTSVKFLVEEYIFIISYYGFRVIVLKLTLGRYAKLS